MMMKTLAIAGLVLAAGAASPALAGDRGDRYRGGSYRGHSHGHYHGYRGHSHSSGSIGFSFSSGGSYFGFGYSSGGYCAPAYRPAPVYVAPPPVVYAPAPVYTPAPVYVAPPPVVYSTPVLPYSSGYYYSGSCGPSYYGGSYYYRR